MIPVEDQSKSVRFAKVDDESWFRLVFTYHGIWPQVWAPLLIWLIFWYIVEVLEEQDSSKNGFLKTLDELFVTIDKHKKNLQMIIIFILGYYVTSIYQRWLRLYESIPWPDSVCMAMHTSMPLEEMQDVKMTMMRYLMISQAIAFMWVSPSFVESYPDLKALMDIKLITEEEMNDLNRRFIANDYEAAHWVPFLWFQNLVIAYFKTGDIDSESSVEMILNRGNRFYDDLAAFIGLAQKKLPIGYTQLMVSCVWGNYYITIFCNHYDTENFTPPFTAILINWLLLGLLFISHEMLYPLHGLKDGVTKLTNFDLETLFRRNLRKCQVILECPLIDKGINEERNAQLVEMEKKLKEAEEQQQKMAAEKEAQLAEMERIEQKLEDAQREHGEADSKKLEEIEKAKEAIRLAQEEAQKAKKDLERVHAEHEKAEQERLEAEKERLRIEKENLAEKKLLEAKKRNPEAFPNLLTKKIKRLPSRSPKKQYHKYQYTPGARDRYTPKAISPEIW